MNPSVLLLADGRFPAGGHAYSAGVESAVDVGDVRDLATLERYLDGRLATGAVEAAFAVYDDFELYTQAGLRVLYKELWRHNSLDSKELIMSRQLARAPESAVTYFFWNSASRAGRDMIFFGESVAATAP